MAQRQSEEMLLEQLWEQWLSQIVRVIRCGVDCDYAAQSGDEGRKRRVRNQTEWVVLKGLERAIAAAPAVSAYGIGIKLAIWRHWRDPGDTDDDLDDPSLALIRSAYRSAVNLSGIDFIELIRTAEYAALQPAAAAPPLARHGNRRADEAGNLKVIRIF